MVSVSSGSRPLISLHVVSDIVIGLSYYAIPIALAYFVLKRKDIDFGWIFLDVRSIHSGLRYNPFF